MRINVSLFGVGLLAALVRLAVADVVYVTSFDNDSVVRFDAETGAPLGAFVPSGSGGLNGPTGLIFGPDGNLYVSSFTFNFSVLKYDGQTGQFLGEFVTSGSGGLLTPMDLGFGPDGNLYVASAYAGGVFRYNGTTGAFIDQYLSRVGRNQSAGVATRCVFPVTTMTKSCGSALKPVANWDQSTRAASSTGRRGLILDLMATFTLPVSSMTQWSDSIVERVNRWGRSLLTVSDLK